MTFTLTAHRGAAHVAPENTVAAFRGAIDQGADECELDLRATRDNALVVIHDDTVDRTTDGTGSVSDFGLADLQRLEVGDGHRIPTFTEVLAEVGDFPLQVELKSPAAVPLLARLLADQPHRLEQFWINTGDIPSLQHMHRLCPQARLAYSVGHASTDLVDRALDLDAQAVFLAWDGLDQGVVNYAHDHGLLITGWMANEPADVHRAFRLGLDGTTTDDVPAVLPSVRACREAQALGHEQPVSHE